MRIILLTMFINKSTIKNEILLNIQTAIPQFTYHILKQNDCEVNQVKKWSFISKWYIFLSNTQKKPDWTPLFFKVIQGK